MHLGRKKGVGCPHDRADVAVVFPVLDRNVERVSFGVELGNDCVATPIAEAVLDVSAVSGSQEIRVEPGVVGPGEDGPLGPAGGGAAAVKPRLKPGLATA